MLTGDYVTMAQERSAIDDSAGSQSLPLSCFSAWRVPRLSQAAPRSPVHRGFMQPTTRPQIDQIRGVNSDGALRNLLGKGLVEEVGRLETPVGRFCTARQPNFTTFWPRLIGRACLLWLKKWHRSKTLDTE